MNTVWTKQVDYVLICAFMSVFRGDPHGGEAQISHNVQEILVTQVDD